MRTGPMFRIVALVVAMVLAGLAPTWLARPGGATPWWLFSWLVNLALMLLIAREISYMCGRKEGVRVKGGGFAILVDNDNRFSLSRLQLVLWMLVVLSAFWTMAVTRAGDSLNQPDNWKCAPVAQVAATQAPAEQAGATATPAAQADAAQAGDEGEGEAETCPAPLDIQIPLELWALMGISMTGAVAAPLVRESKKQRTAPNQVKYQSVLAGGQKAALATAKAAALTANRNPPVQEFKAEGGVSVRDPSYDPQWSDLFMSMDVSEKPVIDMAKVQNFFFTVIAVVAYGVMLGAAFWGAFSSFSSFYQMPILSEGLLAILGISHAAKLVEQNVTPAPTTPTPPPPPTE